MKIFSVFGKLISGISSAFKRLVKGEQAAGASSVQKRLKSLNKLGIRNSAVKKFEAYQNLFKKKHGKDIFSYRLSDIERAEANEIFNMFLSDPTTDEKLLKMKYEGLKDKNLVEDVADIADMAKQIDIVQNRAMAKEIYDNLASPVERLAWNSYKTNEETNEYVELMKDAILNVTRQLKDDGMNTFTEQPGEQTRLDMVLSEYKRLKEDYEP